MAIAPEAPDPALGVFDTLLVRGGRAIDLRAHLERVTRSASELYADRADPAALAARIEGRALGLDTARVRTTYRPEVGGAGGSGTGQWTVDVDEVAEPGVQPRSLAVREVPGGLGEHKWVDRRLAAPRIGADDVLLLDPSGQVLECGTANIFVVTGNALATPPLDGRILPGTVRARVVALAHGHGLGVEERPVDRAELAAADEVLVTSSVRGVQSVVSCREVGTWEVGPRAAWLRELLAAGA